MNIFGTCSNTTIGSLFLANFSTVSEKECALTPAKAVMSICTTITVSETHNLVILPFFPPSPLVPLSNPKNTFKNILCPKEDIHLKNSPLPGNKGKKHGKCYISHETKFRISCHKPL